MASEILSIELCSPKSPKMSRMDDQSSASKGSKSKKQEMNKIQTVKYGTPWTDLWTDGLICAFEFVRVRKSGSTEKFNAKTNSIQRKDHLNPRKQVNNLEQSAISVQYLSDPESISFMTPNNIDATLDADEVPVGSFLFKDARVHRTRMRPFKFTLRGARFY